MKLKRYSTVHYPRLLFIYQQNQQYQRCLNSMHHTIDLCVRRFLVLFFSDFDVFSLYSNNKNNSISVNSHTKKKIVKNLLSMHFFLKERYIFYSLSKVTVSVKFKISLLPLHILGLPIN